MTGNGVFMMIYEIKVGSVTNAQRGAKLLKNAGYRVFVHKQLRPSPADGCGYLLRLEDGDEEALALLRQHGVRITGVEQP